MKKPLIVLTAITSMLLANSENDLIADLEKAFSFKGKSASCQANVLYWKDLGVAINKDTEKPFYCRNILLTYENNTSFVHGVIIYEDKELTKEIDGFGRVNSTKLLEGLKEETKNNKKISFKFQD